MSGRFSIFVCLILCPFFSWSQYFGASVPAFLNPTARCAVLQNQQQGNAAAFTKQNTKGYAIAAAAPLLVSNLSALNLNVFYTHQNTAIYHELSGLFHAALVQMRTAHAIGFQVSSDLKIGIGMQLELLSQPSYYGHYLLASARFGCQYAYNKNHFLALTLDHIGSPQAQQISVEHLQLLQPTLWFTQGFTWTVHYRPSFYVSLSQSMQKALFQLTYSIFPQQYTISIRAQNIKKYKWLFSQSWQRSTGLSLQFGLLF